jgi:hypothetical protein
MDARASESSPISRRPNMLYPSDQSYTKLGTISAPLFALSLCGSLCLQGFSVKNCTIGLLGRLQVNPSYLFWRSPDRKWRKATEGYGRLRKVTEGYGRLRKDICINQPPDVAWNEKVISGPFWGVTKSRSREVAAA